MGVWHTPAAPVLEHKREIEVTSMCVLVISQLQRPGANLTRVLGLQSQNVACVVAMEQRNSTCRAFGPRYSTGTEGGRETKGRERHLSNSGREGRTYRNGPLRRPGGKVLDPKREPSINEQDCCEIRIDSERNKAALQRRGLVLTCLERQQPWL